MDLFDEPIVEDPPAEPTPAPAPRAPDPDPVVGELAGVPIRRSQMARIQAGEAAVDAIRARAKFRPLFEAGPSSGIGVNCAKCEHLGDFSDEARRGWCMQQRHMVGTWHNNICEIFEARTTMRAGDVIKAELERQEAERAAVQTSAQKAA